MTTRKSASEEQKKYVAAVCSKYQPITHIGLDNSINNQEITSCNNCYHWDNGRCVIFDDVLTGIDQT